MNIQINCGVYHAGYPRGEFFLSVKIDNHNGVVCAGTTVKLLGSRLDIYVYTAEGLVVDTGPSRFAREYTQFFQSQPVSHAVLTHFHEDHSGNASWLCNRGVPVYIHPSALEICRKRAALPLYRRFFWGKREGFSPHPLGSTLEAGKKKWRVIETPGHSLDHITLYDPERGAVFTGDLIVTPKTRLIMKPENIHRIMSSLRLLLQYDFRTVYCSHAGVIENGRKVVQMKLDYLDDLKGEVLNLHRKGWSIKAINKKLFPKTAPLTYISLNEWASGHIIRSIIEDS